MAQKNVGICLFDGMELLDFAAPFEVFHAPAALGKSPFNVFTISPDGSSVKAFGGVVVEAMWDFEQHPPLDVLVIPGGDGSKLVAYDELWLQWLGQVHLSTELTLVVCSAARVAAHLRWLDNARFCTHASVAEEVKAIAHNATFEAKLRCVLHGKIITTAGVTAALDGALLALEILAGKKVLSEVKHYLEFH